MGQRMQWKEHSNVDGFLQEALRMRLRELAANRMRSGYRRLTVLLK
jgi:hypothetical protein